MKLNAIELNLLWQCVYNEMNRHLKNGGEPLDEKFEKLDDILIKIRKEFESGLALLWQCVYNETNEHLENGGEPLDEKTELRAKWILQTNTQDFQFSIEKALQQMKEGEK